MAAARKVADSVASSGGGAKAIYPYTMYMRRLVVSSGSCQGEDRVDRMEYSSTNEGSCPHGDCPPGSSPTKTLGLLSAEDFASEFVVPGQYGSAGLILYGGKRHCRHDPPRPCLRTRHDT